MGFLNNTSITVDAILTKKGRELLARGQNEFKITKFALADDEIDYHLWDTTHPNGSNYYGAVIENMPLLESFVDENQVMRYKLVTLPKNTARMPVLVLPAPTLSFTGPGGVQTINPVTRNGSDNEAGYMFVLHDATIANLTPHVSPSPPAQSQLPAGYNAGSGPPPGFPGGPPLPAAQQMGVTQQEASNLTVNTGATTPVFVNEEERKNSITISGMNVRLVSRSVTTTTSTNLTVVGLATGATFNIVVTVNPSPSAAV